MIHNAQVITFNHTSNSTAFCNGPVLWLWSSEWLWGSKRLKCREHVKQVFINYAADLSDREGGKTGGGYAGQERY